MSSRNIKNGSSRGRICEQAKQAMEARFRDLLAEAVQIAEDYRADFGAPLKPPSPVTAFRYKASGKSKPRKSAAKQKPATRNEREPPTPTQGAKPNPKFTGLQKQLATATRKRDEAKASGKPTNLLKTESMRLRTSCV
jgi:hypothetical protein